MTLLSDTIFGNGRSIPGQEDISVLRDLDGFPYYRGSTFKGIFREELKRSLIWEKISEKKADEKCTEMLGSEGSANQTGGNMVFSDIVLSDRVKHEVLKELHDDVTVIEAFTHIRVFTKINDEGTADSGSLRSARCVNKGLIFYGCIKCENGDRKLVERTLSLIKWIGTMRNRGFGHVRIEII